MDDYDINNLSEAKNEWSLQLINTLTEPIFRGIKDIFKEAWQLCYEDGEPKKYLMTFQLFLQSVPNWNQEIVNQETKRIIKESGCDFLDDLITTVHVTQAKIMTCIRVTNHRKFIKTSYPKIEEFIHKVYKNYARKLWENTYLFRKDVPPLQYQQNMRMCKTLCKESIMDAIRESIPIEDILKSYMDETTDEDVIEKVEEVIIEEPDLTPSIVPNKNLDNDDKNDEKNNEKNQYKKALENAVENMNIKKLDEKDGGENKESFQNGSSGTNAGKSDDTDNTIKGLSNMGENRKSEQAKNNDVTIKLEVSDGKDSKDGETRQSKDSDTRQSKDSETRQSKDGKDSEDSETRQSKDDENIIKIDTPTNKKIITTVTPHSTPVKTIGEGVTPSPLKLDDDIKTISTRLRFNDEDKVLDMGTNQEKIVNAPKDIERLEQISEERNQKRKAEAELFDDEDDEDDDYDGDDDFELMKISDKPLNNFDLGFSDLPPL